MSLEALWSLSFESDASLDKDGVVGEDGIIVFEAGRIFGGGSALIYTGEYSVREDAVRAKAHIERYAAPCNGVALFGFNEFTLRVGGRYDEKRMTLRGLVAEDPRRAISMQLIRRAELPQGRRSAVRRCQPASGLASRGGHAPLQMLAVTP